MTALRLRVSMAVVAVMSLALRWAVPPAPIYSAFHDDRLLVKLAAEIRRGNWLGPYTDLGHLTQAKPPGFSMFLAWTSWLPWAPTVTVHLIVIAGAALLAFELRASARTAGSCSGCSPRPCSSLPGSASTCPGCIARVSSSP